MKSFCDLLGRRLEDPDDGRVDFLKLVIRARFPQFRTYPIKTIYFDELQQILGLIPSLLIDGKSLTWQVEEKLSDGSTLRDSSLMDLLLRQRETHRTVRGMPTHFELGTR